MGCTRICLPVLVTVTASFLLYGCEETSDAGRRYPAGAKCQVVLRSDALEGFSESVTPPNTKDHIPGSFNSVWGRLVRIDNEWVVVSVTKIRVTREDEKVTTYGKAGEQQHYEYWVPRSSVLFIRTWND